MNLLVLPLIISVTACSQISKIASHSDQRFSVSSTGMAYTTAMHDLRRNNIEAASAHCAPLQAKIRQSSRGWQPMRDEISFECIAAD